MEPLEVKQVKDQIECKIASGNQGAGILAIYDNKDLKTPIKEIEVNLVDGKFELPAHFTNRRFFLKLTIGNKTYFGALRHLELTGLYNLRDLGGYQGQFGSVKWGLLYRSDALDGLNQADLVWMKNLAVETVIDLRSQQEIERNPDQEIGARERYEIDPSAFVAASASAMPDEKTHDQKRVASLQYLAQSPAGREKLEAMKGQMIVQMHDMVAKPVSQTAYAKFLTVVLNAKIPILFHCQGGKDRTGWGAALLLGLLGIDEETIMQDYLLTKQYNVFRNSKRMASYAKYTDNELVLDYLHSLQQTKSEYLNSSFKALKELAPSFEVYAEKYLNFSADKVKELRHKFLSED
ncbi:tyrosine-protein phosphatase [Xylocopilactobacillus apicola]|uniref:Protein-tyrosine-phosphatase n=1 Tax=Xylocopilactobacillus apicola TaxID=2932184 RepID=A0AAU9D962_9LACO|nr:tyrosine-protein phosphatase [Xylocopilactobacillus apicola]BDR58015.1 protein-tyrosine-phosphatase [Xylocopilactobacillus apicola]